MSIRAKRVAGEIKKVLSESFVRGLKEPFPAVVTILDVVLPADLSAAQIYYSVFGDAQKSALVQDILGREQYFLRSEIARKIRLRKAPTLSFILDTTPEKAIRIHQLLDQTAPTSSCDI